MIKRKWLFGVAALALVGIALLVRGSGPPTARRLARRRPRVVPVETAHGRTQDGAGPRRVARQRHADRQRRHQGARRHRHHRRTFRDGAEVKARRPAVHARWPRHRGADRADRRRHRRATGAARRRRARRRAATPIWSPRARPRWSTSTTPRPSPTFQRRHQGGRGGCSKT